MCLCVVSDVLHHPLKLSIFVKFLLRWHNVGSSILGNIWNSMFSTMCTLVSTKGSRIADTDDIVRSDAELDTTPMDENESDEQSQQSSCNNEHPATINILSQHYDWNRMLYYLSIVMTVVISSIVIASTYRFFEVQQELIFENQVSSTWIFFFVWSKAATHIDHI